MISWLGNTLYNTVLGLEGWPHWIILKIFKLTATVGLSGMWNQYLDKEGGCPGHGRE